MILFAGKTPLRVCCTCGHLSCAESLISHGADVEFRDLEGRSIVYMLSLENRAECIMLLADSGAGQFAAVCCHLWCGLCSKLTFEKLYCFYIRNQLLM